MVETVKTKICAKCKIEKKLEDFAKCKRMKDGLEYRCRQCKIIYDRNWRNNNREKCRETDRKFGKTIKGKYKEYKSNVRRKNHFLSFNLTLEQFFTFWKKDCNYCGNKIEMIGIDRVDNNIGYEFNNCVSCCEICNRMKLKMSVKEFLKHCEKIIELSKKRGIL